MSAQATFGVYLKSWEATAALAAVGWILTGLLLLSGRSSKYVTLAAYAALIETLQVLQFAVLDQCSSKVNQLLTLASYAHVALQPLVFNEFVWGQPQAAFNRPIITPYADSVTHKSIRRLTLAGAGLFLLKAAPAFVRFAGLTQSDVAKLLGAQAGKMLAGPSTWCDSGRTEAFCGRQLCSFTGKNHIGWIMPLLPHSYLIPSGCLHMALMHGPSLVLGGTPQRVMAVLALLTGPVSASQLVDGERGFLYEWAAIWSFFSVVQVLLMLVVELLTAKLLTGSSRLPPAHQTLGSCHYTAEECGGGEAETEATAIIHLYQQQLAGYKQQLGGYNKLH